MVEAPPHDRYLQPGARIDAWGRNAGRQFMQEDMEKLDHRSFPHPRRMIECDRASWIPLPDQRADDTVHLRRR